MEQLNINHILDRNQEEKKFIECLEHFEKEKQNILNNQWLSDQAGTDAANFIRKIGLENGTIALEKAFLPADTFDSLQKELPDAKFVDAVWALEELRVINPLLFG